MADGIVIDSSDFEAQIDAIIAAATAAAEATVTNGAHLIERYAKSNFGPAHAKGSPKSVFDKPQSVTGTLRRSITVLSVTKVGSGEFQATVAPTVIYGRRTELGFHGTDSLGRNYNNPGEPAYPYLTPAVTKAIPDLQILFTNAWNTSLNG